MAKVRVSLTEHDVCGTIGLLGNIYNDPQIAGWARRAGKRVRRKLEAALNVRRQKGVKGQ